MSQLEADQRPDENDASPQNRLVKRCTRFVVALAILHAAMLAYGASVHGPGWDEVGHLAAGISHWELGSTDLYRVNPPLVRLVDTLPLNLFDVKVDWTWDLNNTYQRPEWDMGRELWKNHGLDAYRFLTYARWVSILWSLLGIFVIYRWSRELYGPIAGVFSVTLWCFSPLILSNAQMITPDTGASALGLAAAYSFWKWLHNKTVDHTWLAGVLLGLAELAKFTWVILFILWPALFAMHYLLHRSDAEKPSWRSTGLLASILLIALVVINIGYGLEGSFKRLGEYEFISKALTSDEPDSRGVPRKLNRFTDTLLGAVPVPLPRNYVLGIDRQKVDFEEGFPSYLRGQWRDQGWWYFYLYGIVVKEPIGFLCLFLLAIAITIRRKDFRLVECYLLLHALLIIGLVSSQTGFNHHLRYVLPAFPFLFVWMGKLAVAAKDSVAYRVVIAPLLLWSIVSSAWVFPHSHAYFNELAGGPLEGHHHLLDSNIDWGQDVLLLAKWVEEHPEIELDGVAYSLSHLVDLDILGIPQVEPPRITRLPDSGLETPPEPGWYAVFVRPLREEHGDFEYFLDFEPVEQLGYTVYIYHITESDIAVNATAGCKPGTCLTLSG